MAWNTNSLSLQGGERFRQRATVAKRSRLGPKLLVAPLLLMVSCTDLVQEDVAIPAGRENTILGLFEPSRLGDVLPGGYRWDGLSIGQSSFTALLVSPDGESPSVRVEWSVKTGTMGVGTSRTVKPRVSSLSGPAREGVNHLSAIIESSLDANTWSSLLIQVDGAPFVAGTGWSRAFGVVSGVAALLLFLLSLALDRVKTRNTSVHDATDSNEPGSGHSEASLVPSDSVDSSNRASDERTPGSEPAPRRWGRATLGAAALGFFPLLAFWGLRFGLAATRTSIAGSFEALFVTGMFAGALLGCGALLIREVGTAIRQARSGARWRVPPLAIDVAVVAGWSCVVRLGLTSTNILTDGGSGWARLLGYSSGYSGLSVLVKLIKPDSPILDAIVVPQVIAAMTPALLVLVARELRFGRAAGLLAGLALASLPVHAALYSSDFEAGAVLSLLLLGLWLLMRGRRLSDAPSVVGGLLVIAWGIWGRPEAIAIGLSVLAILIPSLFRGPRFSRLNPAILGGLAWLAVSALIRFDILLSLRSGPSVLASPSPAELWSTLSELLSSAVTPWWLWMSVPVALIAIPRRARPFVTAFAVYAALPIVLLWPGAGSSLETVRYGTGLWVLFALLAGLGWERLARYVSAFFTWTRRRKALVEGRPTLPEGTPEGSGAVEVVWAALVVLMALAILATPLTHREYLSRIYGPTFEHQAFTSALEQVPAGCLVVVPDDLQASREGAGTMEVFARYGAIAKEAHAAGLSRVDSAGIMGSSQFLDAPLERDCILFFAGVACVDGGPMEPVSACDDVARRFEMEPVASFSTEYFSHRMISRPNHREHPHYDPNFELTLFRLKAKGSEESMDASEGNDDRTSVSGSPS